MQYMNWKKKNLTYVCRASVDDMSAMCKCSTVRNYLFTQNAWELLKPFYFPICIESFYLKSAVFVFSVDLRRKVGRW